MKDGVINKYIHKYQALSAPLKASVWFAVCNILQKGISMITVPVFTRILTTAQFGVFSVYQSWSSIVAIFATLNLFYGVFNNGMVKFRDNRDGFTSSLQVLTTVVTTVVFIIYLIFHNFWNSVFGLSTLFVMVMFVELYFTPAYSFWAARQRFEYKYKLLVIVTLLQSVLTPLIGIIAVLSTTYKAEARVISYVLVEVCIGFIFYLYNLRKGKQGFVRKYWKFALAFNIPLIPHYLSQTVLQQSDRIMISALVGKDKAAIYSVAYNISSLMALVTNAINNSFIPYTYDQISKRKFSQLRSTTNALTSLVAILSVLVMLFGPEVVKIFAPPAYYEAIYIIPPVSASIFFIFLYPIFANVEFFFEENKFVMVASVLGAVLNILLNLVFIPKFGYLAAGYTTLVCYMVFSGAHYGFMKIVIRNKMPEAQPYNVNFIFALSIMEVLFVFISLLLYRNIVVRYAVLVLIVIGILVNRRRLMKLFESLKK
ncbi:lipopolysaccharide biosynthesis protein [Lacticaseibacillus sp. N501-2]|uniref:lipopolysaccharide biosynthesis protein n=1 Tax=Lacticaseibacillus salsurae TaxID=3367729 RepID=UPI0038B3C8BE